MSESSEIGPGTGEAPGTNGQPGTPGSAESQQEEGPVYSAQLTRILIGAAAVGGFTLFWWVGVWLHIPQNRGLEASLLQLPGASKALAFVVAALLLAACAIVGHLIAGRRWLYTGPFVAAFALAAWSFRGGPSRYVYFHAAEEGDGQTVLLKLALELALLSSLVGVIWYFIATRARALAAQAGVQIDPTPRSTELLALRLQAIGAQVLMTALLVMFLTPIDLKKEAMASVFIASFVAASFTEYFLGKADLEAWFWVAPAVTGIIGYLLSYFFNAPGAPLVTGHLAGVFAPLARPLPLDYASAGIAAALLGFWTGGEHPEIAMGMILFSPGVVIARTSRTLVKSAPMRG